MAFDIGSYSGIMMSWLMTPFIWLIIIGFVLIFSVGMLILRKRRKFIFPLCEIVPIGDGKANINIYKKGAGWFGKNKMFFGLIDRGEIVMKAKRDLEIRKFSNEDFHEVNGERAVLCVRDPFDQKILLPITRLDLDEKSKQILIEIPDADYTRIGAEIIEEATRETSDMREKMIQWLIFGGLIIFALVSIIVISQMVKNGQDKAASLILEAGKTCLENSRQICNDILNNRPVSP